MTGTTGLVQIRGIRVRVRTTGTGRPLVTLMGVGGNPDMRASLAERLPDRQLVMFDFPGTGAGPAIPGCPRRWE